MRLFLLLGLLLLTACSTTTQNHQQFNKSNSAASVKALTTFAKSLVGVPYKYGGSTPQSGFDCSGFVKYVFKHSVGVSLPHNSRMISRHGIRIKRSQLHKGDLVFFDTNKKIYSHVGIYLGNNTFIHAPKKGSKVRIVKMNNIYWKKHYNGARRISF